MSVSNIPIGLLSYSEFINLINSNFIDVQAQAGDVTAITNMIAEHNTDANSHKALFDGTIKNVTYAPTTGTFTFTKADGTTVVIDTLIEKVVTNFVYNPTTSSLELTLGDGSTQSIPLTALVDTYLGSTGSTIDVTINPTTKVISANVKNASITWDMLSAALKTQLTLKAATTTILGGVKASSQLKVAADGTPTIGSFVTFTETTAAGEYTWTASGSGKTITLDAKYNNRIPIDMQKLVGSTSYESVTGGFSINNTTGQISFYASDVFSGRVVLI